MSGPAGPHIVEGQFQSDKYPDCPRGLIPFKAKDKMAQDLLWTYAERRSAIDPEFAADLQAVLSAEGYSPPPHEDSPDQVVERARRFRDIVNSLIARVEEPEGAAAPVLQLTFIHRNGYKPGPTERGQWVVGYRVVGGLRNGEWSGPFGGMQDGATMFDAVEQFYLNQPGARP